MADEARRFLAQRDPKANAAARWREFVELGWLALAVHESRGGSGASDCALAVLMEQIGYARCDEPYLPVGVLAAGLLCRLDGHAALEWLEALLRGAPVVMAEEILLKAEFTEDTWRLTGRQPLVLAGDVAEAFLLPATDVRGDLRLFVVAAAASGLTVDAVQTVGGCQAADLTLRRVAGVELSGGNVGALLDWSRDRAAAMACADAVGAMRALLEATIAYTNTRVQFRRPLAEFQVIEHYRADLLIAFEEARAVTQLAVASLGLDPLFRHRAVSAAKVKVGTAARSVAQQAIQMHGAMGVTEELSVGLFAKRLLAFAALWGTCEQHLQRYSTLAREEDIGSHYLAQRSGAGTGVNLSLETNMVEFCDEVRDFLAERLPMHLRIAQQLTTTVYPEADIATEWHRILHTRGWSACNWPAQYGGTGWSPEQRYVWAHECAAAGAPIISPLGLPLVGPVIMHFGTPEQRARFLPPIVSGTELWCQGFSEPGAGSDLAALTTRATPDGADYVINGSKIWTTQAHVAHFMAALVRTGPAGGRREGISFLLIDMRARGISVRPIMTIGGDHELNQVFFDQVRVPQANRVGAEGDGWAIAKYMLEYERGGDIMSAGHRYLMSDIRHLARDRHIDAADAFWREFAATSIDIDTLEMLELRALLGCDEPSTAAASILKLRASETQQKVTELGLRVLGRDAVRWASRRPLYGDPPATAAQALVARYLNSRANTIFGGSREIQKTLIARAAPAV